MENLTETIKNAVCSVPVIIFLLIIGLYFTCRSRFFAVFKFKEIFRTSVNTLSGNQNGISPLSAFATALGGTVGVGSIFGMGHAIAVGGAGSIFWMWVCAFFSMAVKYAETFLAVKYRYANGKNCAGGAMYILKNVIGGKTGKYGAIFFCICCIAASFGCGNMAQTVVLSELMHQNGIPNVASAFAIAFLSAMIIFKGKERIEKANSYLIPIASISYFFIMIWLMFTLRHELPHALQKIFSQAFGADQAIGGLSGYTLSVAFKEGALRGTFSHEAGMGSSPIAHASSPTAVPEAQGALGIAEIFIDTFVVGTMTALCLIAAGCTDVSVLFKNAFGNVGNIYLLFAVFIFAFGALLSWCFYGESCVCFLSGDKKAPRLIYEASVVICAFLGCLITSKAAYDIADTLNYLMMIPNIYLLFKLRRHIKYGK